MYREYTPVEFGGKHKKDSFGSRMNAAKASSKSLKDVINSTKNNLGPNLESVGAPPSPTDSIPKCPGSPTLKKKAAVKDLKNTIKK